MEAKPDAKRIVRIRFNPTTRYKLKFVEYERANGMIGGLTVSELEACAKVSPALAKAAPEAFRHPFAWVVL